MARAKSDTRRLPHRIAANPAGIWKTAAPARNAPRMIPRSAVSMRRFDPMRERTAPTLYQLNA
jgi:hypothetical protein